MFVTKSANHIILSKVGTGATGKIPGTLSR
jgi:hypothetical protein